MIEHYDGVITLELKDVTSGDTYNIVEYVSDIPRNLPMYFLVESMRLGLLVIYRRIEEEYYKKIEESVKEDQR